MIISKTTNALSLRKRILFTCAAITLVWGSVEAILHASTYLRLLPYVPTITPSLYTRETVKFKVDKNGSPIFVDGYKVYRQQGIFPKPRELDSEGYVPVDAKKFGTSNHKIAFFGDSYTEGLQVDGSETFPRLIEDRLKQNRRNGLFASQGKSAVCFNFGISGTGTYHQYLRYLTVSEETDLNDVVLCFLPQNDVLDNHEQLGKPFELPQSPYLVVRNGKFVEKHPDVDTTRINRRLNWFRSTIGTSFVATGIYRFLSFMKTDGRKQKAEVWKTRTSWLGVYGLPLNDNWAEAWAITEEVLLRFAKAAEKRKSRFTLVIVADSLQISDAAMLPPEVASACDFEYPNRHLRKFCEEHDIVCLDSLPFFLERKRSLDYPYFSWEHDGHYSQIGHQTLADFIISTGRFNN